MCGSLFDLPPIVFVIDGIKYPLYPEDYLITIANDGEIGIYAHRDHEFIEDCAAVLFPLDYPEPLGIN